jgi:exosome complex protein LRP1
MSKISKETVEQLAFVDENLAEVDELFRKLNPLEYDEVVSKMPALDRAKYDLTVLYAINSLFWMYMRSLGEDPKTHGIKHELDRIKQQMLRVKEITDKEKMPRIDQGAAGRMIRHGLWQPKDKSKSKTAEVEDETWEDEEPMNT